MSKFAGQRTRGEYIRIVSCFYAVQLGYYAKLLVAPYITSQHKLVGVDENVADFYQIHVGLYEK